MSRINSKLRVVFDASCRNSSGESLNDLLMVGPTVQEDLYSTLILFRFHKFVITADIKQMYRCLTYLSQLYKEALPIGANVIQKDFYVDDLLTGADCYEDIISIRDQATKRNILSVASRLFDPLGLLCPLVTKSKMLLQELWIQKLDWDESIPMYLDSLWQDFKSNLSQLDSIQIPRFVRTSSSLIIQIHGFADASIRANGCCIYVRSFSEEGVLSRLLTAKPKIAPLKTKSLPRLELCAAQSYGIVLEGCSVFHLKK
ncbi:uncharacterized protein LOC142229674 [Haematobia irritans]|uniref:uncharacterized protein LOC142229674 n=1 Tax=Haematobia irritans TaxID=7368 RepID=UPI003F4FBE22